MSSAKGIKSSPRNFSEAKDNIAPAQNLSSSTAQSLPGNSYIPTVGVHTTLLIFNGLFLPRTTFLQDVTGVKVDPAQLSSLDRPQHSFLEPLTLNPSATIVYICIGAAVLQSWWAGYIRDWWSLIQIEGSENEKRIEQAIAKRQKVKVRVTEPSGVHPDTHYHRLGIYKGMACNARWIHHFSRRIGSIWRTILLVRIHLCMFACK